MSHIHTLNNEHCNPDLYTSGLCCVYIHTFHIKQMLILQNWLGSEGLACCTHVEVMVRKRSCPAVSQICSFTFSPFISTVRILKSTPMVVM